MYDVTIDWSKCVDYTMEIRCIGVPDEPGCGHVTRIPFTNFDIPDFQVIFFKALTEHKLHDHA